MSTDDTAETKVEQVKEKPVESTTSQEQSQKPEEEATSNGNAAETTEEAQPSTHPTSMITFNCELCNVQCSSEEVFETHLKGQKHHKKVKRKQELEQSGMADRIKNSDTYCKVCSVELTSKAHMPLHLAGKRHRQNMMKALSAENSEADVTKTVEEFEKKQKEEEQRLIDRAGIKDFEKYAIPAEKKTQALAEGAKNEFYCKICNKFFTGRTQLAMHIMSARHKEKETPGSRPKRPAMRGGRRFFDTDSQQRFGRPYPTNFHQNSVSDLSSDFSLPASKLPRLDSSRRIGSSSGSNYRTPPRRPRNDFLISPERSDFYDEFSSRMPAIPPKPFYSTYQVSRPSWRRGSPPSRAWPEARDFHNNYWDNAGPAEPPYWPGNMREEFNEPPAFSDRMNDFAPSANRSPNWYSSQPPHENYYEDYNPVDFDSNFYRGPL